MEEGYADCCATFGMATFHDVLPCIFPSENDGNVTEKFSMKEILVLAHV